MTDASASSAASRQRQQQQQQQQQRDDDYHPQLAVAARRKDEGNALLTAGDYEDALAKYEEGLAHLLAVGGAAGGAAAAAWAADESWRAIRVPLLLNAVLCDLRMNPEEQVRRLATAEERIAEVLLYEPANPKAHFRRAQLLGRAGDYGGARALLEQPCRQQPNERAFRAELASLAARAQADKRETAAFWQTAARKTMREAEAEAARAGDDDDGGGGDDDDADGAWSHGRGGAVLAALLAALCQWILSLWRRLAPLSLQASAGARAAEGVLRRLATPRGLSGAAATAHGASRSTSRAVRKYQDHVL